MKALIHLSIVSALCGPAWDNRGLLDELVCSLSNLSITDGGEESGKDDYLERDVRLALRPNEIVVG